MISLAQYRHLLKECKLNTFNWLAYGIIMLVVVPLALLSFHLLILGQFISIKDYVDYISLRYAEPNVFTMFLSNYAHMRGDGLAHLTQNILTWELTTVVILATFLLLIPSLKYKYPNSGVRFNGRVLVWSAVLYFLVVPFFVSGVSIVFGNYLGIAGGLGFSGITYAFCGFLVYLGSEIIEEKAKLKKMEGNLRFYYAGMIVVNVLPLWILGTICIDYLTTPGSGIYGHVTGFLCGLIIPWSLERWWRGREVGSFK